MDRLPANHTSYYQVLNIPKTSTPQDVKNAYHKYLLTYHPDKQQQKDQNQSQSRITSPSYSISEVQNAYKTLINAVTRSEYDLLLHSHFIKLGLVGDSNANGIDLNGIDHVDLSEFTETDEYFVHSCPRCKFDSGFVITDDDLENGMNETTHNDEDEDGDEDAVNYQLLIQCASCSLWLCVTYSIT